MTSLSPHLHHSVINGSSNPIPTSGHFTHCSSPPLPSSPLASSLNPQNLCLLLIIGPSPPDQGQIHSLQISDGLLTHLIRDPSQELKITPYPAPRSDPNHNLLLNNVSISIYLHILSCRKIICQKTVRIVFSALLVSISMFQLRKGFPC